MKVLIVAFNNIAKSPYINIYADFCRTNGVECEVLYPDRDNLRETAPYSLVPVKWNPKQHKLLNFLYFRDKTIKYLKETKPDFVIVLTTMPAVLLSGYLSRYYKGRYLVDIRDYTYENVGFYYLLEQRALKNAAMRVISSPGFKNFLPDMEYNLCQNINPDYEFGECRQLQKNPDEPITIGYVGTIAYKKQCMRLIKLVERDERFRFFFYGGESGDCQIAEYLERNPCQRIKAFGPYQPSEKVRIMRSINILFNAYGNGNNLLDYALSNKLYDSFFMRIPLLTSPKTSMSEEAGPYSYDINLENETSLDGLFDWYCAVDNEAFDAYSKQYLARVFDAQRVFYDRLRQALIER